jgi:hypothetical protein
MVASRVLGWDKGYDWGMIQPENFKGKDFMKIEIPEFKVDSHTLFFNEKRVIENGVDIRPYDPEINFVGDNEVIDGEFQDPKYFEHRLDQVREWLKVEPIEMQDDVCVINFRGGEYVGLDDLFLPREYWGEAIQMMLGINPLMRFEVHTDDPETARKFFNFPIIHDAGYNWRSISYAKYLILSNSSFAILPALLNQNAEKIIAPRYWARHNTKVWALPQNYYKQFTYI